MRVTISNFVSYGPEPAVFEFTPGRLTLIRGTNGTGKTTLLKAIIWCFYGNARGIYGGGDPRRCYVQIELPGVVIYRQTESRQLVLTLLDTAGNPVRYEGQVAQDIINGYYGTKNVWMAASYLKQKSRCLLTSGTSSEKLEILNKMGIRGEDPRMCIDKISESGKIRGEQYRQALAIYNSDISRYQQDIGNREPITKYNFDDAQFSQLTENLRILEDAVETLSKQQVYQASVIGIWNTLVPRRKELISKISTYTEYTEDMQKKLTDELETAKKHQKQHEKASDLKSHIRDLAPRIESLEQTRLELAQITVTQDDYRMALEKQTRRQNEIARCDTIGLPYRSALVNQRISEHQVVIDQGDQLEERERLVDEFHKILGAWNERKDIFYKKVEHEHQNTLRELDTKHREAMTSYQERKKRYLIQVRAVEKSHEERVRQNEAVYRREMQQFETRKRDHNMLQEKLARAYQQRKLDAQTAHSRTVETYQQQMDSHQAAWTRRQTEYQNRLSKLEESYQLQVAEYTAIATKLQGFAGQSLYEEAQVTQQSLLISRLESCRDIMSCPHCFKGVRMNNGQLQASDDLIPNLEKDIAEAKQMLTEIKNGDFRLKQIKQLEAELKAKTPSTWDQYRSERLGSEPEEEPFTFPEPKAFSFEEEAPEASEFTEESPVLTKIPPLEEQPPFEDPPTKAERPVLNMDDHPFNEEKPKLDLPEELAQLSMDMTRLTLSTARREMAVLDTIEFIENPNPTPATITGQLERRLKLTKVERFFSLLEEVQMEMAQMPSPKGPISELQSQLNNCTRYVARNKEWKTELERVEERLAGITIDSTLDQRLADNKTLLAVERERHREGEYTRKMNSECLRLEVKRSEVLELHQQVTDLEELRQEALDLETHFLETTVDNINFTMNNILANIFDEPIKVEIELFKTSKSTKRVKICPNLRIEFRGVVRSSVEEMSGGEGDKVSLAMILAINQLTNTPVLLLDETFAFIDKSTRDVCLEIVKNNVLPHKVIMGTTNAAIDGFFDDYIDLESGVVGRPVCR